MIGEKLQALLDAKHMRAGTLAARTGISKSTIYGILKRNNKKAELSTLERIAEELDVPVEYFFGREEPETEQKNQPEPEEDELEEFVQLFEMLSTEQKSFILSSMKGILAEQ